MFCQNYIMNKYKGIEIPIFNEFEKPIFVENRNFRTKNTKNYFDLSYKEVSNLPQENGLIVSKDIVRFVNCPICDKADNRQLFVKWGFKISVCDNCDHTFVENQMIQSALEKLYSESDVDKEFQVRKKQDKGLNKYWILLYSKYLQLLRNKKINNTLLLDVGAGGGDFIELCSAMENYKLHAMEFSNNSADFLASIVGSKNLYKKEISNIDFKDKKFGVISMWGVLEHINDPIQEFKKCKEILDIDGRIVVLIPNLYSRAFKILGLMVPTLNPRSHVNFYTNKSIDLLCNKVGLEVEEYYQELPVIDLMYDYIDYNSSLIEEILDKNESYYSVYIIRHKNNPIEF
jgi:2-polyprenyl-3-methyl-5-hydroxy-6-metoxy-1,4-benzoquinol methylase